MPANESCTLCEKIEVTFKAKQRLSTLLDLPNTYDQGSKKFIWKHHDLLEYALIPRKLDGTHGEVELCICMDEDELDDIDLTEYAGELLQKEVLPAWKKFSVEKVLPALLSPPQDIECFRCGHEQQEKIL
ncbi:MAG: hypothetical protein ABSF91_03455 [Bacteroidota bacterium]|jgi:hypothetical protein